MQENGATTQEQQLAVVEQKRKTWGEFGASLYKNELALQAKAKNTLRKLEIVPSRLEDIPAAEETLKVVKGDRKKIEEDRKSMTSKLDQLCERLMLPEKSIDGPLKDFEAAVIKLKRTAADESANTKLKTDEVVRLIQEIQLYVANVHASLLSKQADLLAEGYKYALENVPPEKLQEYLVKIMARVNEPSFTVQPPQLKSSILPDEEITKVISANFKPLPAADYISSFKIDVDKRFSDYNIAWQNKEQARLNAAKEDSESKTGIEQMRTATTIASRFAASSEAITPTVTSKELKESYEIDMPETFENAVAIMAAFIANKDKCMPKVKIDKWFNFNANSAGKALAKVKNDDNKFAPSGIKFKKVDKL